MPSNFEWDAFISHASEDKGGFVLPLALELQRCGLKVWYDEFSLTLGDSLRESIEYGLSRSRFGIVVLSHCFFGKKWPRSELNGLFAREMEGHKVLLPIWHGITKADLLEHAPILADKVAANSSEGIPTVTRRLIEVIRPEAFIAQTSRNDGQRAFARMLDQLRAEFTEFDYRVTVNPSQGFTPSQSTEPGLIGSCLIDGLRIDLMAKDPGSYNKAPLRIPMQFTQGAAAKVAGALKTGERVTFELGEVGGLPSQLLSAFGIGPHTVTGVQSVTIVPSPALVGRKVRFRLTFSGEDEQEVYSFVEFEIVRVGSEVTEIRSCAPQHLAFVLTLKLNRDGSDCHLEMECDFNGHEIRNIQKANRAFQCVNRGGSVELFHLDSDRSLGVLSNPKRTSGCDENEATLDAIVQAAYEIAIALNRQIVWNSDVSDEAAYNIWCLREVVLTGFVAIPTSSITLVLSQDRLDTLTEIAGRGEGFTVQVSEPPDFATIFGITVDLGPHCAFVVPGAVLETSNMENGSRTVSVQTAKPIVLSFERFRPQPESE